MIDECPDISSNIGLYIFMNLILYSYASVKKKNYIRLIYLNTYILGIYTMKCFIQTFIHDLNEHFLIACPTYEEERKSLFKSASKLSIHFNDLSNYYKFMWIMFNENETLIKKFCIFLIIAFEKQPLSYQ